MWFSFGFMCFLATVVILFAYVMFQFVKQYKILTDTITSLREVVLISQRTTAVNNVRLESMEEVMAKMELAQIEYIQATKATSDVVQNIVVAVTFNADEIDQIEKVLADPDSELFRWASERQPPSESGEITRLIDSDSTLKRINIQEDDMDSENKVKT